MWARIDGAQMKVQRMQTKLHRWARGDSGLRFDDLFNLVHDPDFLLVAWQRVAGNRGAHTPGIDEVTKATIQFWVGVDEFLGGIRSLVKSGEFRPVPVRRVEIPKANGKLRQLCIPTLADRVVQASLKLVLEPIFEADFHPSSYGFRPFRRAQHAIAEVQHMTSRGYVTVLEADIRACFDQIDHTALMCQTRLRVGDKKVLALVRAFLKAGIMTRDGQLIGSKSGTPQGGILSPLLANIALHVLDEHAVKAWAKDMDTWHHRRRLIRNGGGAMELIRYADDFVCVIYGSQAHALALKDQVATILAPLGLELSEEKTRVVTIEEGLDFLGFNIRRMRRNAGQVLCLHDPIQEIDQDSAINDRPNLPQVSPALGVRGPLEEDQMNPDRVGKLFPAWDLQESLQRYRLLHVEPNLEMVAAQTRPDERTPNPAQVLRPGMAVRIQGSAFHRGCNGHGRTLPLPRSAHPHPVDAHVRQRPDAHRVMAHGEPDAAKVARPVRSAAAAKPIPAMGERARSG